MSPTLCGGECGGEAERMDMGKLTQGRIRQLKEPGRYSDGDGLFLELNRPGKGNWQLRATVKGNVSNVVEGV